MIVLEVIFAILTIAWLVTVVLGLDWPGSEGPWAP